MKRIVCLLLASLCLCSMMTACSNTEPKETEPTMNTTPIINQDDPSQDNELNILMVGNSFCYYYVEELYGMLTAAGYENVNVCNVYYSGCSLDMHWNWWKNGEANYSYFTTNKAGRNELKGTTLEYCLKQHNWDIISLQDGGNGLRDNGLEAHLANTKTYRTDLLGLFKEQFPLSRHFWHHTWSYQVGYNRNGYKVTAENQDENAQARKDFAIATCKEFGLERVNSGEAWKIVRDGGYDDLCARLGINGGLGDYYHDGDIGGGQYLNACVWFETITGQSCVGNTYRPDYELSEDMIEKLQAAAHQAVEMKKVEENK